MGLYSVSGRFVKKECLECALDQRGKSTSVFCVGKGAWEGSKLRLVLRLCALPRERPRTTKTVLQRVLMAGLTRSGVSGIAGLLVVLWFQVFYDLATSQTRFGC